MSVSFTKTNLRLPRGFNGLLHDLCREVLKHQPHDIHAFSAQYISALIEKRRGMLYGGMDGWGGWMDE